MVNLSTHIRDVVNHVLYEDLDEVTLVGFSYGGFVVTGSLEHIFDRVRHLVFLDAFVPTSGETVFAHIGRPGRASAQLGESWLLPPPERQFDDPEEGEWISARRIPHPVGCFTEPVYLSKPLEEFAFDRTYIKAKLDPNPTSETHSGERPIGQRTRKRGAMKKSKQRIWSRAIDRTSSPQSSSMF